MKLKWCGKKDYKVKQAQREHSEDDSTRPLKETENIMIGITY